MKTLKPRFGPELLIGGSAIQKYYPIFASSSTETRGNGSTACKNETKIKFNGFAVHTIKVRIFAFFKTNHF
jgi:hypothetical protein